MEKIKKLIINNLTFIKYIFSAGFSFILDLTLFTLLIYLLKNKISNYILIGTIGARVISSFFNYLLNRNAVFKSNDGSKVDKKTIVKYYLLVIIQMCISGILVSYVYNSIKINATIIKIPIEIVLFVVNYFIQKKFIFNKEPNEIKINSTLKSIVLGILSTFTILVDLNKKTVFNYNLTNTNVLSYLILGIFLIWFYKKYDYKYKSNWLFRFLALLLSIFMVVGYSYDTVGSAYLVFGHIGFIIISLIKLLSFYYLFNIVINIVYDLLCNYKIKDIVKKNKFIELFNKHPFIVSATIIFICYIPYLVAFYPAVMGYDPSNQIREFMGMHTRYMDSVILLDPNQTITNFNPVLHTLLLGGCFKLGHIMGNDNIGLFIYVIIQCIILISVLSYSIYYMKKQGVINKLLFIVLGIYALVPVFPFYAITTNKDTIFCCFVLLYCIKLYDVIANKQSIKKYITFFIIMLLVTLTRNNGIYTIVLSLPFALIWLKDKRKPILATLACVLVCYIGYNKVILPAFKISNTSTREMLSIPFQQTARLAKYHPEAFSDDDKEKINKVFVFDSYNKIYKPKLKKSYEEPIKSFDTFAELYDPSLSDPIKNQYNIYTTKEELMDYFGVWAKGLVKYPDVYIDSTINNIYGYFYPDTSNWYIYYKYNSKLKSSGFDYHYNSLSGMRNVLSSYGTAYPYIPVIGLIVNIGFVGWIYFFLFVALIVKKKYKFIPFILPALSFILVCVAGPANTYFRYALPYVMTLPLTLCLLYYVFQNEKTNNKKSKIVKIDK